MGLPISEVSFAIRYTTSFLEKRYENKERVGISFVRFRPSFLIYAF